MFLFYAFESNILDFSCDRVHKNPPANKGDTGSIPGPGRLLGATKPVFPNHWTQALEPDSSNCWACVPQLLKPACLEPMLCDKRSHHNEKAWVPQQRVAPTSASRESPSAATKPQSNQKLINKRKTNMILGLPWQSCDKDFAFLGRGQVRSLVGQLRSNMPCGQKTKT